MKEMIVLALVHVRVDGGIMANTMLKLDDILDDWPDQGNLVIARRCVRPVQ